MDGAMGLNVMPDHAIICVKPTQNPTRVLNYDGRYFQPTRDQACMCHYSDREKSPPLPRSFLQPDMLVAFFGFYSMTISYLMYFIKGALYCSKQIKHVSMFALLKITQPMIRFFGQPIGQKINY